MRHDVHEVVRADQTLLHVWLGQLYTVPRLASLNRNAKVLDFIKSGGPDGTSAEPSVHPSMSMTVSHPP